jgi:hypothetical protein
VVTIGYFALAEEWRNYDRDREGFSSYLVAHRAEPMPQEEALHLKDSIRARQGQVPDSTRPAIGTRLGELTHLGVIDETADSISFGVVATVSKGSDVRIIGSVNTVLWRDDETLSLYAFTRGEPETVVEDVKSISRTWIACIRANNAWDERQD